MMTVKCIITTGLFGIFAAATVSKELIASNARVDRIDSYVNGLVLTQILQHADLSNSDLIEMSSQSKTMKISAEDLMVQRLKSWLSPSQKQTLESEAISLYPDIQGDHQKIFRHYVTHFFALEKAWRSASPSTEYHLISRGYRSSIVDFDPANHDRILMVVKSTHTSELYLVDTATSVSYHLMSSDSNRALLAKFIPSMPDTIIAIHDAGISAIDIKDPGNPSVNILQNKVFTNLYLVPGSLSAVVLTSDNTAWSIRFGDKITMKEKKRFGGLQQSLTSTAFPGMVFSVRNEVIDIWKPEDESYLKQIDISADQGFKSIFLHENDLDLITALSSSGKIANYSIKSGKRNAHTYLGHDCGRSSQGAGFSSDGKYFLVACRNDIVEMVDAKTLESKAQIETKKAHNNLIALGGRSKHAVSWDDLGRKLALINTEKKSFEGYLTRNCGASLTTKVFSCLRLNGGEPFEFHDVVLNPWDSHRILTTNAISLTVWDTNFKSPNSIPVFEPHLDGSTKIFLHPYNPNIVYMVKFGGWLAVLDFWHAARELVKAKG